MSAATQIWWASLRGLMAFSLASLVLAAGAAISPAAALDATHPIVYVPETGHHLQLGFLDHWRRHQGPARLGYPLTEEYWLPHPGAMVQHFERGRLEWSPETPGTVHEIPEALDDVRAQALGGDTTPMPSVAGAPLWWDALAPPAPAIAVMPAHLAQGRTLLVEVSTDDPALPLAVTGSVAAPGAEAPASLHFFALAQHRHAAIYGAAMNEPLGDMIVRVTVQNGLGLESPPQATGVQVVDGGFSVQHITTPGPLVPLLDPEVRVLEQLTLATVLSESAPEPLWRGLFLLPLGGPITTAHGARRTYFDPAGRVIATSQHAGIDIAAPAGAPVAAPAAGIVAFAGTWSIAGNVLVLDHGAGVHSVYAHLSRIAISANQPVARGQVIAFVGSTGLSTGPHLHWEVRAAGKAVDPLEWTRRAELGLP